MNLPLHLTSNQDNENNQIEKEERKRVRRERILQKLSFSNSSTNGLNVKNNEETEQNRSSLSSSLWKSDLQIANSKSHLYKKKSNGILRITELRVKTDHAEHQRRVSEEKKRHQRMLLVNAEKEEHSKNEIKKENWNHILDIKDPRALRVEIEKIQKLMDEAVDRKDKMIQLLRQGIKEKDDEYVKGLNKNALTMDELRKRINEESKRMDQAYRLELSAIEDAFSEDRDQILEKNKQEINELMKKENNIETSWIQRQDEWRILHQKEVEEAQAKGDDEYNKLKIKLEKDVHKLEYQLEDVQASHQLNADKLEHNLRVLVERDEDNKNMIKRQKKKYLKNKQDLSRMKEQLTDEEKKNKKKLDIIGFEYGRIDKQYEMLQKQFIHFETADRKKYEAVKAMHIEEITDLEKQIKDLGKRIEFQVLGNETNTIIDKDLRAKHEEITHDEDSNKVDPEHIDSK